MIPAVVIAASALFLVGAAAAIFRIVRGPTMLDRILASDVLLAITISAIGAEMVVNRHTDTLALMLVLSLVGVLGTIAAARFLGRQDDRRSRQVSLDDFAPRNRGGRGGEPRRFADRRGGHDDIRDAGDEREGGAR